MRSLLPCVALAAAASLNAAAAFFAGAATEPDGAYYLCFSGGAVEMPTMPPLGTRATLQVPPLRAPGADAGRVRALVLGAVRRDFARWPRVSIREGGLPEHPLDNVVVVGGRAQGGALLGLADAVDAGDGRSDERAVVFAESLVGLLHAPSEEEAAQAIANTVSHEIGHLLGFAHAKRRGGSDIMFPGVRDDEAGLEQAFLIHHQSYAASWRRRA
jgi:hypothetical protein